MNLNNFQIDSAIYALLISFLASVVLCPLFIPLLQRLKFGQPIRSDGPKTHLKKSGTPTMGGIVIITSFILGSVFFLAGNADGAIIIFVTLGYAVIGFIDDYLKVTKQNSKGLIPRWKLIGQIAVTSVFAVYIYLSPADYGAVFIPFTLIYFDLGWWFYPFLFIVMLATGNGVNLTDGLDGLASGVTLLIVTFFLFIALVLESSMLPLLGAAIGSLLGFLLFNSHPARVIMGDTGSLALGGLVASSAILLRMPVMILIVGFVYVAEVLSVTIQTRYFKYTRLRYGEGRRIFKKTPIHHHFEESGFAETRIVALFYIVTAICCLIGYLAAGAVFK